MPVAFGASTAEGCYRDLEPGLDVIEMKRLQCISVSRFYNHDIGLIRQLIDQPRIVCLQAPFPRMQKKIQRFRANPTRCRFSRLNPHNLMTCLGKQAATKTSSKAAYFKNSIHSLPLP